MKDIITQTKKILLAFFQLIVMSDLAIAQKGPGLGNLQYNANELFKTIWLYTEVNHYGSNNAAMVNGYFVTTFHPDSGKPPGGILVYDVSNPRSPVLVSRIYNSTTSTLRECHAIGNYQNYIAIQDGCGIQIWDLSDGKNPVLTKKFCISGYKHDDYGSSWQIFWQAPYIYIANGAAGFDIVDATDVKNPVYVKHVSIGMQAGPIFAIGNLLVTTGHDTGRGFAVLDISDPKNPKILSKSQGTENLYASTVNGNRIITSARGNSVNSTFSVHDFSDPYNIKLMDQVNIGNAKEQLYCVTQDQYIFQGCQDEIVKIDATDVTNLKVVGRGSLNITGDKDHGQVTPFGNLIFVGNDHGSGNGFIVHQTAPDTKGPEVNMVSPKTNSVNRALTTRVGITLTDNIDLSTVNNQNFIVRPIGGQALTGKYSHLFSILNFAPDQPLLPNTSYEVIITKGGFRDWAGNPVATGFTSYFSTGPTGTFPPAAPENVLYMEQDKKIFLSWNKASGASNYLIKRSDSPGGPFSVIGTTTLTTYNDLQVENGTIYYYMITGENSYGQGLNSAVIKAMPDLYITDLTWTSSTNGWGPAEVDQSNGENTANDGRMIQLEGEPYTRGLGVHAPATIAYNLNSTYRRFISNIGIDDEVGVSGSVIFQVLADNKEIYKSALMKGNSPTKIVDVDVVGVKELKLILQQDADNSLDHASWGGARLIPAAAFSHRIPGTIETEQFDEGGEGTAYHDNDATNTGNAYRKEGVDIKLCSEGGFNTGWTAAGEWIKYTATVSDYAKYRLKIRVATATNNQKLHVEIDNKDVTGILTAPNTGGLDKWQDIVINDIIIAQGSRVVKLVCDAGDVHVNYLRFDLTSIITDVPETGAENVVQIYHDAILNQLTINSKQQLIREIKITDMLGRSVYESAVSFSGIKSVSLDRKLNSGVYIVSVRGENTEEIKKIIVQ